MVGLNLVYDLLQTTKISSSNTADIKREKHTNQIYFVICNSCYWCASYFGIDELESLSGSLSHVLDCHVCSSHNTELIPISADESFRIDYNLTTGMQIEFYKSNSIVIRQQSVVSPVLMDES